MTWKGHRLSWSQDLKIVFEPLAEFVGNISEINSENSACLLSLISVAALLVCLSVLQ